MVEIKNLKLTVVLRKEEEGDTQPSVWNSQTP